MSESSIKSVQELIEYHGGFIFANQESSRGVDKDGQEFDHAFMTEDGRVSYDRNEDGTFTVTLTKTEPNTDEKRTLSFDQLKEWFYSPTNKYYQETVSLIELLS